MSDSDLAAVEEKTADAAADRFPGPGHPPLAEKALSEAFARLRYRDTSLLIWQQQQQDLQTAPPSNYLNRSESAWYSSFGNQAVVVRNKKGIEDPEGRSRICSVM